MKTILFATLVLAGSAQAAQDSRPKCKDIPYDADLFCKDRQVYSGHAEFLFWRVQEGDLDFAQVMNHSAWGPSLNYAQGTYRKQTWNGDPGFRLALSYFRAPHFWEVKWEYTRYTGRGSNHVNKPTPPTNYLTGTWPQIIPVLSSAKSNIHMNYNVFDMLIDRYFSPNPHLRLRLFGGGSMAWINQQWVIQYFNSSSNSTTTDNKWDYMAGGLKAGFMVDWFWGICDFYMTFKAMTGGFLGSYQNRSKQKTNYPQAGYNTDIPFRDAHFSDVRAAYTFQLQIGPSFQHCYTNNRIEIFAGYELNGWFNLQEVYRSTSGAPQDPKETFINSSMLALQGLTTRLTVDF